MCNMYIFGFWDSSSGLEMGAAYLRTGRQAQAQLGLKPYSRIPLLELEKATRLVK